MAEEHVLAVSDVSMRGIVTEFLVVPRSIDCSLSNG